MVEDTTKLEFQYHQTIQTAALPPGMQACCAYGGGGCLPAQVLVSGVDGPRRGVFGDATD